MWQYFIIAIILLIAVSYAVQKVIETLKAANDPCGGCAGCAIHDKLKQQQKLSMGRKKPVCYSTKKA